MGTVISLVFCILLGVMVAIQGWTALLWVPVGFVVSLFISANIVLPIILGFPLAIRLVRMGQMRAAVFWAIVRTPAVWCMLLCGLGFGLGVFWRAAAAFLYSNLAFIFGCLLGILAIVLSPFSSTKRAEFREDFDKAYCRFYTEGAQEPEKKNTGVPTP